MKRGPHSTGLKQWQRAEGPIINQLVQTDSRPIV